MLAFLIAKFMSENTTYAKISQNKLAASDLAFSGRCSPSLAAHKMPSLAFYALKRKVTSNFMHILTYVVLKII